jgi:PAS domain S-box-containing protein
METVRYCRQGTEVDVLLAASPILVDDELIGVVGVYTDISERKQAERALRKANRELQVLSRSNEVLSRAKGESDLLHAVCEAAVEVGGYRLAWVGLAEQDLGRMVRPVAQAGYEEGYLESVQISWDDSERGRGPTGTAIRTGRPAVARNILTEPALALGREQAIRRGYASSIALPLMAEGRTFGALSILAAEPDAFDTDEVDLLAELADNLAYGITALQTRAERQRAEEVLRHYAERLETLHQIDRAIVEAQSPEAIAQATLARIGSLVPCRRARIMAFGSESAPPTALATHTDSGTGPTKAGDSSSAAPAETARAQVSIPLMAQGELIGVLHMESRQGSTFTPEQIETVYEVATPLAVAIQNARLHEQLRQYAGSLAETVSQRTRELKAERDRTQAILESLGEAVIVSDVSGAVLYTNPAVAELTGFRSEETLGQNWWALQGDGHSSTVYAQAQAALGERKTWRGETTSRRKDGTLYDAEVTVAPLFSPEDISRLIGSVWVQRDISPLKEAERIKDQFVSNVSHELRTPLSVLTLSVGNLDRLYARLDDDKRRGIVRSIREQVALLNDLVGDVLEVSRIDSGSISAERQEVDLALLVREEADKQRPLARARRQVLRVIGLEELIVRGDEGQLRQVIRNLVDNGIKFTPEEGQITCECRVQVGLPILAGSGAWITGLPPAAQDKSLALRRWAVLRVLDTGIGIEQKDILHLCERFFRVKTQGNIPGTGLGLSIARELVELNGGRIAVASVPGEGSAFSVFLPLEED